MYTMWWTSRQGAPRRGWRGRSNPIHSWNALDSRSHGDGSVRELRQRRARFPRMLRLVSLNRVIDELEEHGVADGSLRGYTRSSFQFELFGPPGARRPRSRLLSRDRRATRDDFVQRERTRSGRMWRGIDSRDPASRRGTSNHERLALSRGQRKVVGEAFANGAVVQVKLERL